MEAVKNYWKIVMRNDDPIKCICTCISVRELLYWAYLLEQGKSMPKIGEAENKAEFWHEALKYEGSQEQRIRMAKALYYLANKVNQ